MSPQRFLPPLLLLALTIAFFAPLVSHPTHVLYSDYSDLIGEHLPVKRFIVRSFRETGELPLWCPYRQGGTPLVHDIQAALFYPPHLLLLLLSEEDVAPALSWFVAAHVLLAGLGMYLYARHRGLDAVAALVSAFGFMFAGKWSLQVLGGGHYPMIPLAWLPLGLFFWESAVRRRSLIRSAAAGLVFGVLALGTHPQYTFYAAVLAVLWTLAVAFDEHGGPTVRLSLRWLGCTAVVAVVAIGVAAVQLFPTVEASRYSTRGAGVGGFDAWSGGLRALLGLVGPTLTVHPAANQMWEDRTGWTALWLFAAVIAPVVAGRRVRYESAVALTLVVLATIGGVALQELPGFRLFRQPTRLLVLIGLPLSYFAGVTTQHLFDAAPDAALLRRCRGVFLRILVVVVLLVGGLALRLTFAENDPPQFHPYWLTLVIAAPCLIFLLTPRGLSWRYARVAWCLLLVADLWSLTLPLVDTRETALIYDPPACVRFLAERCAGSDHVGRVLDVSPTLNDGRSPVGSGAPLAMLYHLEAVRGDVSLDNARYKKYLQYIAGVDGPLLPFQDPLTFPVTGDVQVVHKPLLDLLLGRGYLVQPTADSVDSSAWEAVFVDPSPAAYDFIAGGRQSLPSYTVYRNRTDLSRAFVVHRVRTLPPPAEILSALSTADLAQEVFLEDAAPIESSLTAARAVQVTHSAPNHLSMSVDDGPEGWLVLADLWYPGWTCTIDGESTPIRRADSVFRAVPAAAGRHTIEMTFAPRSYFIGRIITLTTLAALAVAGLVRFGRIFLRRRKNATQGSSSEGAGVAGLLVS